MDAHRARGPRQVLPAESTWLLFDVEASRAVEAHELARHPAGALMQQAGRSVARLAMALAPHAQRVWIAAGPGGNGGDGLNAAADLAAAGRQVTVALCADASRLPADAQTGLLRAREAGVDVLVGGTPPGAVDLAIDALLGIGSNRAPEGAIADAISRLNDLSVPRLAIDLPSGLSADTGARIGALAVEATATLSLLTLKPGLFTGDGRDHAGEIWFDDLDANPGPLPAATATLSSPADDAAAVGTRRHVQHKGSFGDVVIVGGAPGMTGAAHLAAHAALGAGAGRTLVSLLDTTASSGDDSRPEWLWCTAAWLPARAALDRSTVVCGCGGGTAVRAALPALLSRSARLVLDADALNAVAADDGLATLLRARGARGLPTVLTPHPLEAARLLRCHTADIQRDRLSAARTLAAQSNAVVVLKGSGTVIAAPGGAMAINSSGNARLATGGTGDVLAGWIGGLWAQAGLDEAGDGVNAGFRCAVAAVWRHGAAAEDSTSGSAVRARDLVDSMRALPSAL